LFEGEGCVHAKKAGKRKDGTRPAHSPTLEIKLTDEDVLRRFHAIVGGGNISGPYWANKSTKPYWSWSISARKEAKRIAAFLYPFLGRRRSQRVYEVFGPEVTSEMAGLDPAVLERYATYMHGHRKQADGKLRASDNWKKGIPREAYMKSLWRHMHDFWSLHHGQAASSPDVDMEEALCAILFNTMGYLHTVLTEPPTTPTPEPQVPAWERLDDMGKAAFASQFPPYEGSHGA
jgi:hypothetical protein